MRFLYATLQNLAKFPVRLLGFFIVPFLWPLRKRPIGDMPRALMPWVNPEDWTGGYRRFPPEYNCLPQNMGLRGGFWSFYWYHAGRNGGDGLRNYDWHVARIISDDIEFQYHDNGYTVYQDRYGSWFRRYNLWGNKELQVKYGFRMKPEDALGYNRHSFRHVYGSAPASSFRIRERA